MRFENGKVSVLKKIPDKLDSQLIFVDENAVKEAATQPPNKLMLALMENRMVTGRQSWLSSINQFLSFASFKTDPDCQTEKRNKKREPKL